MLLCVSAYYYMCPHTMHTVLTADVRAPRQLVLLVELSMCVSSYRYLVLLPHTNTHTLHTLLYYSASGLGAACRTPPPTTTL